MDKTSYAIGMAIASNMVQSGINKVDIDSFAAGVKDSLAGQPTLSGHEAQELLNEYFADLEARQQAEALEKGAKAKAEGEAFLAENATKEGVVTLKSGLQYKVIKEGNGRKPKTTDKVRCHYEGTLPDGTKFDSSYDRNEPAVFGLNQVISGWTEGLQLMSEGSVWMLYLPYDLGYGQRGAGANIPPYAALVFKVELIEVL